MPLNSSLVPCKAGYQILDYFRILQVPLCSLITDACTLQHRSVGWRREQETVKGTLETEVLSAAITVVQLFEMFSCFYFHQLQRKEFSTFHLIITPGDMALHDCPSMDAENTTRCMTKNLQKRRQKWENGRQNKWRNMSVHWDAPTKLNYLKNRSVQCNAMQYYVMSCCSAVQCSVTKVYYKPSQ